MTEISQIPPLILHPFSGDRDAGDPLEGIRADIALLKLPESDHEDSAWPEGIRKSACSSFWARTFSAGCTNAWNT
jgi:hypothetical protein